MGKNKYNIVKIMNGYGTTYNVFYCSDSVLKLHHGKVNKVPDWMCGVTIITEKPHGSTILIDELRVS